MMENVSEPAPIIYDFSKEDIPRCPQCNLICLLKLKYKSEIPLIEYLCENGHKGKILLKDYDYNKFSLFKEKCNECGKNQKEINGNLLFCTKCQKFICYECQKNHSNDQHNIINIQKYDSICKLHSNTYDSYCFKCKKNLCFYCKFEHENHNLTNLSNFKYSIESKKIIEEEINSLENKIKYINNLQKDIINELEKINESSSLEIKFLKILFNTYEYEEQKKNLNYYFIHNLKSFKEKFELKRKEYLNKIYNEGNKFLKLLQNSTISDFKIIKEHTNYVNYLCELKDGRLASCSNDKSLNIYKKDSYELQLSIKEHLNWVISFTQLNDGRIVTSSKDNTMKIVKLLGEDKYQIEQTLIGHKNGVEKVIEIRQNELISVSCDKTMKVWKFYEQYFLNVLSINFQKITSDCNILKLNETEFVTSSYDEECLKFWEPNNYSNIANIHNIDSGWPYRVMCLLENDILCVGGMNSKGFYLIRISTHNLINIIIGPKHIFSIYKCLDDLFLCSIVDKNGNNCIVKYKYKDLNLKKIIEMKNPHNKHIISCFELSNGIIASCGYDNLIKLWKSK